MVRPLPSKLLIRLTTGSFARFAAGFTFASASTERMVLNLAPRRTLPSLRVLRPMNSLVRVIL